METFIKILRWIFYVLVAICLGCFIAYNYVEPQDEAYFRYAMYSGFCALGLSAIRFVLRFI